MSHAAIPPPPQPPAASLNVALLNRASFVLLGIETRAARSGLLAVAVAVAVVIVLCLLLT